MPYQSPILGKCPKIESELFVVYHFVKYYTTNSSDPVVRLLKFDCPIIEDCRQQTACPLREEAKRRIQSYKTHD